VTTFPAGINLKKIYDDMKDPEGGMTTYLGEKSLPFVWFEKFYAFQIYVDDIKAIFYFNKETKDP